MKLFICGNGLDKHMGFESDYTKYRDFLCEKMYSKIVVSSLEKSKYFGIADLNKPSVTWSNLEDALDFDYKSYIDDYVRLFNIERNPPGIPITDEQMNEYNKFSDMEFTRYIHQFTKDNFQLWLSYMYNELTVKDISKNYSNILRNILGKSDKYLTFNYTTTLEDIFGIRREDILYIHNRFPRSFNESKVEPVDFEEAEIKSDIGYFQFGSINNIDSKISEYIQSLKITPNNEEFSINNLQQNLEYFCRQSAKNINANFETLERFIDENTFETVIILGHSFMGIDFPYYEKILIPKLKHCNWEIYYHTDIDYENANIFGDKFSLKIDITKW